MTFKKIAFRFRGYSVQKPTGLLVFSKQQFAIFPITAKSSLTVIEWRHRRWRCIEMTSRGQSLILAASAASFFAYSFVTFPIAAKVTKRSSPFRVCFFAPSCYILRSRSKPFAKSESCAALQLTHDIEPIFAHDRRRRGGL